MNLFSLLLTYMNTITMQFRRNFWFGVVAFFGVSVGLLMLVFRLTLTAEYGYNDDYELLFSSNRGMFGGFILDFACGGRPLLGPIVEVICKSCVDIRGLWVARATTLVGLALLATVTFATVRVAGWGFAVAVGCALGTVLGPGCAVFAGWATCAAIPYAGALALVSGVLIQTGTCSGAWRARIAWCASGIAAMVLAYMVYQPVAAFAVFAILVLSWKELVETDNMLPYARSVGITLTATALYFAIFKVIFLAMDLGVINGAQAGRGSITLDWLGKGLFLIQRVFGSGFSVWGMFYGMWAGRITAAVFILLSLVACLRSSSEKIRFSGAALIAMIVTLFLSVLPIAVVVENHEGFRTQIVLHSLVVFFAMVGLDRWTMQMKENVGRWTMAGCVLLFCGLIAGVAHRETNRGIVKPNAREVDLLRREVSERFSEYPEQMVYVTPTWATRGGPCLAEFSSRGSSQMRWITSSMLNLLLLERFPGEKRVATVFAGQPSGGHLEVIDGFRIIHKDPGIEMDDPFWGRKITYSNGWSKVAWFGCFDDRAFPWVLHSELGWINCATNAGDGFWFYHNKLGWLWTSPRCYPDMKRAEDAWIHYSRQIGGGLMFFNYGDGKWFSVKP